MDRWFGCFAWRRRKAGAAEEEEREREREKERIESLTDSKIKDKNEN